jgi:hypothetical protein
MQSWERDKVPYLLSWAVTIMRHRAPRMVLATSALELDAFTPGPSATVRDGNRLRRLMRERSRGRCRAPEAAVAWSQPLSCATLGGSTSKGDEVATGDTEDIRQEKCWPKHGHAERGRRPPHALGAVSVGNSRTRLRGTARVKECRYGGACWRDPLSTL